jgi:uncharacterized protein (DUF433 family)
MSRYPLNLPAELRQEAARLASRQGISLNQFILWSVAEKVGELRRSTYRSGGSGQPTPIVRGSGIRVQTIVIAARQWALPVAQVAAEYGLSERQVEECLAFYAAHRAEIEAAIEAEERISSVDA